MHVKWVKNFKIDYFYYFTLSITNQFIYHFTERKSCREFLLQCRVIFAFDAFRAVVKNPGPGVYARTIRAPSRVSSFQCARPYRCPRINVFIILQGDDVSPRLTNCLRLLWKDILPPYLYFSLVFAVSSRRRADRACRRRVMKNTARDDREASRNRRRRDGHRAINIYHNNNLWPQRRSVFAHRSTQTAVLHPTCNTSEMFARACVAVVIQHLSRVHFLFFVFTTECRVVNRCTE